MRSLTSDGKLRASSVICVHSLHERGRRAAVHPAAIQWLPPIAHAALFGGNHTHVDSHLDGPQKERCMQESTVTLGAGSGFLRPLRPVRLERNHQPSVRRGVKPVGEGAPAVAAPRVKHGD